LAVYARIRHDSLVNTAADPRLALVAAGLPVDRPAPDPPATGGLGPALVRVRGLVAAARFPLALPGAPTARRGAAALLAQLDDYLLPRLERLDAPLLAVVGGSTGAGKSTLVNSLIRAPVSPAGVLRPTTRAPVLVAHPIDMPWFTPDDRVPGAAEPLMQTVHAPFLQPGLALVDAPDLDSVVAANRAYGRRLLAAGDLWLFVTTAARYADAVPWAVLREARDRGVAIGIVLDRLPVETAGAILAHFGGMLAEQGLDDAPLFAVRESTLDAHGMLAAAAVEDVKEWLDTVAADRRGRDELARRTILGTVGAVARQLTVLAGAAQEQDEALTGLARTVRSAYADAMSDVRARLGSGAVLRGDVFGAWQELVVAGELAAVLHRLAVAADTAAEWRSTAAQAAATPRSTVEASATPPAAVGAGGASRTDDSTVDRRGRSRPAHDQDGLGRRLRTAICAALAGLITEADVAAAHWCAQRWRTEPAGAALLAGDANLGRTWPGFADAAHDLVHRWQTALSELATDEPTDDLAVLATIAAVAPPAEEITGTGTLAVALRSALTAPGAAELGERARADFLLRVGDLLSVEVERHLTPIAAAAAEPGLAGHLQAAAAGLRSELSTRDSSVAGTGRARDAA